MSPSLNALWNGIPVLVRAPATAFVVLLVADLTSLAIFGNLKLHPELPWALPATLILLTAFWYVATGQGWPAFARDWRQEVTRQRRMKAEAKRAAIAPIILTVLVLMAFRLLLPSILLIDPPEIKLDLSGYSSVVLCGLLASVAVVAGVTEEIAFRGYLQKQMEDAYGLVLAIAATGATFWLAHADKVAITHLPFHMLASLLFGLLAYFSKSLWPAIIAHTAGDLLALPVYALRGPEALWSALQSRPLWEGASAMTISDQALAVWDALSPQNLAGGPHQTFTLLSYGFLALLPFTAWSFARLAAAARDAA